MSAWGAVGLVALLLLALATIYGRYRLVRQAFRDKKVYGSIKDYDDQLARQTRRQWRRRGGGNT